MSIIRDKNNPYIILDKSIILHPKLSFEGIGYYTSLEARFTEIEDVPQHIILELIAAGYLEEVK